MRKQLLLLMTCFVMLFSVSLAQAETYRTLRNGEVSQDVATMQQALIDLGFLKAKADGKFGTLTENAIRAFQKKYRLDVDGVAGTKTLELLYEKADSASTSAVQPTATPAPAGTASPSAATAPPSGSYATLEYGDSGDNIKKMQSALNALGYSCGSADGKFGPSTYSAVRAFQKAKGLKIDGKAGNATLTALYNTSSASGTATVEPTVAPTAAPTTVPTDSGSASSSITMPSQSLRLGMKGDEVKNLQKKLNEKGYSAGSVDGVYGNKTVSAVKAVQTANRLTVDGVAGTKTYAVLWAGASASDAPSATAAPTIVPDSSYQTLAVGSSGADVKKLQNALKTLNYEVSVDGEFGGQTKIAVTAFQNQNGLTASGSADAATLTLLYSGNGKKYVAPDTSSTTAKTGGGPSSSQVQLLHWFNDVKPSLKGGSSLFVYDPATNINWTLKVLSNGRHCDAEPATQADTDSMYKAFGNKNTWNQRAVYVKLPDGRWTLASTHNVPHLSGSIKNNGFDGHLCVHFLRDMAEAEKNDPNYGVSNQKTIRSAWKSLTGITYEEK